MNSLKHSLLRGGENSLLSVLSEAKSIVKDGMFFSAQRMNSVGMEF